MLRIVAIVLVIGASLGAISLAAGPAAAQFGGIFGNQGPPRPPGDVPNGGGPAPPDQYPGQQQYPPPPQPPPTFNPSTPYTLPQSPETPVSPGLPGALPRSSEGVSPSGGSPPGAVARAHRRPVTATGTSNVAKTHVSRHSTRHHPRNWSRGSQTAEGLWTARRFTVESNGWGVCGAFESANRCNAEWSPRSHRCGCIVR